MSVNDNGTAEKDGWPPEDMIGIRRLLRMYFLHLSRLGLSDNTCIAYRHQVSLFLIWLGAADLADFCLSEPSAHRRVVSDYEKFLIVSKSAKSTTIKAALTAISNFCEFIQNRSTV
jgi:site-specific recombinase XerD